MRRPRQVWMTFRARIGIYRLRYIMRRPTKFISVAT